MKLSQLQDLEVKALVDSGYYRNTSELFRDALRNLFEVKPSLRISAAIQLYKEEKVSLEKASEISGLSLEEFKEVLANRGLVREIGYKAKEELDRKIEELKRFRN